MRRKQLMCRTWQGDELLQDGGAMRLHESFATLKSCTLSSSTAERVRTHVLEAKHVQEGVAMMMC